MRILIITQCLPWPLTLGGNVAQFSTLECLIDDHEFTLVCPIHTSAELNHARELAQRLPKVRVRAVLCGATRMRERLRPRRILGGILRRVADRISPRAPAREAQPLPPYPFSPLPPEFVAAIAEEVQQAPDVIQCEFVETLTAVGALPPGIPRIFVHHQIHEVYARRFEEFHGRTPQSTYLVGAIRVQEGALLREFDSVIVFSEQDRGALQRTYGIDAQTSPFPIPADVRPTAGGNGAFGGHFLLVGSEIHRPNADALEWLLAEIWPGLQARLPESKLVVVGEWSAGWAAKFAGTNVQFRGFVPDLASVLAGGIMLVPVRIGSGIRTKILAAFAQGTPVVSTTVGCEGIASGNSDALLVGDTAEAFIEHATTLANDGVLRQRLVTAARDLVERTYSPAAVRRRRNEIYADLPIRRAAAVAAQASKSQ